MKERICELCGNNFKEFNTKEKCLPCKGSGYVEDSRFGNGEVMQCKNCNGSGVFSYIEDAICEQCYFDL